MLEFFRPSGIVLSDANPCMVELWRALVLDGWDPPDEVPTLVEFLVCKRSPLSGMCWRAVKDDPVRDEDHSTSDLFPRPVTRAWIGWVGLVAAYRGNFCGQYEKQTQKVRWAMQTTLRMAERLRRFRNIITLRCCDFATSLDELPLERCVVVCDPPYLQCTGYGGVVKRFDYELFWRRWLWQVYRKAHSVFVCEYLHNAYSLGYEQLVVWRRAARHGWSDRYQRDEKLIDCVLRIRPLEEEEEEDK